MRDARFAADLLDWYDDNARVLPWRVGPGDGRNGVCPEPYHVWLSEIMLQQTTVTAVKPYFEAFLRQWPTVTDLAKAPDDAVLAAWAGLGYYARARNLLKCARVVAVELNGHFPRTQAGLEDLPGIGPYTAAAIAAIAFDTHAVVVDGNVERVVARVRQVDTPLPQAKPLLRDLAGDLTPRSRFGDYAQAMMDLGATICVPKNPRCAACPVSSHCASTGTGLAAELPRRSPKKYKPTRRGTVFVAYRSDGAWLLERRPSSGLLGGMLGWPGSDWVVTEKHSPTDPPFDADWQELQAEVRHVFTHFNLVLRVRFAEIDKGPEPRVGEFYPSGAFSRTDLPSLMRKVFDVASAHLGQR